MRSLALLLLTSAVICAVLVSTQVSAGKGERRGKMFKCGDGNMNADAFKGFKECNNRNSVQQEDQNTEQGTEATDSRSRSPQEEGGSTGKGKRKGKRRGAWGKMKMMMNDTCAMVCVFKKNGLINEKTGIFEESGCKSYIDKAYPEDKREPMFKEMKGCEVKLPKDNTKDDKQCKEYDEFKDCLMEAHKKVCGGKPDDEVDGKDNI